ncbi:Protein of unknown function [Luteibacter sp. UNCMF331Sha3.1]|nr:Protein of unknown function [Luteibacter sp. UNCMF331Sha3.1]
MRIPRRSVLVALILCQSIAYGYPMSQHARGTFDVAIAPVGTPDVGEGSALGTMTLSKTFHGVVDGTSKGTMLTAGSTGTPGSAAYVAVERFQGTVDGRKGGFALVHRGVMSARGQDLVITIVPDSGSGELKGIAGSLGIEVKDGKHFYDLEYTLP